MLVGDLDEMDLLCDPNNFIETGFKLYTKGKKFTRWSVHDDEFHITPSLISLQPTPWMNLAVAKCGDYDLGLYHRYRTVDVDLLKNNKFETSTLWASFAGKNALELSNDFRKVHSYLNE